MIEKSKEIFEIYEMKNIENNLFENHVSEILVSYEIIFYRRTA